MCLHEPLLYNVCCTKIHSIQKHNYPQSTTCYKETTITSKKKLDAQNLTYKEHTINTIRSKINQEKPNPLVVTVSN
jgi:hypothetical protein